MTKFSQINKKFKIILAFSLLGVLSENSFAASIDNLIENNNRPKHQYKLIFEKDKQNHESRDFLLSHSSTQKGNQLLASYAQTSITLPTAYDIRQSIAISISEANALFPVYDQGQLGSCTANAAAGALQFKRILEKLTNYVPSRLFIYYNERKDNGYDVTQDTGAQISESIASIVKRGASDEKLWPYSDVTTGTKKKPALFTQKPTAACYTAALSDMDLDNVAHANIPQDSNTLTAFKTALYNNNPILIGINIYDSFESASTLKTGIIPMPNTTAETLLGGHALMVTGYDDAKSLFSIRNSWGSSFGDAGHFYLPYAYLTNSNLASDFWMVAKVGKGKATTPAKSIFLSNLSYYSSYAFSRVKYVVSAPFNALYYLKSSLIG